MYYLLLSKIRLRGRGIEPEVLVCCLHNDESGLRGPYRASGQSQGLVPAGGDDGTELHPHRRDLAVLLWLRAGKSSCRQDYGNIQTELRTTEQSGSK